MQNPSSYDEYSVREDAERKRKLAHEVRRKLSEAERQRVRELHWMHCPKCGSEMHEVRYRGMSVDVCLSCKGMFLDEGELSHMQKPESKGVMSGILNWFKPEIERPRGPPSAPDPGP